MLFNSYAVGAGPGESISEVARRISRWTEQGVGVGVNLSPLLNSDLSLDRAAIIIGRSQDGLWRRGISRTATMILVDLSDPGLVGTARRLSQDSQLRHLNMAVRVLDAEMRSAVEGGEPAKGQILELLSSSLDCGNPGFVFVDRVNREPSFGSWIDTCNACAEQFLEPDEGVPLCSVNLAAVVSDGAVDWTLLEAAVRFSVQLLDRVIDVTGLPSEAARAAVMRRRRIGVGVMGLDSAFRRLGLQYGTDQAVRLSAALASGVRAAAQSASRELALANGAFPDYTSAHPFQRNGSLLSIAPTGGISTLWGVSSGIEPIFGRRIIKETIAVDVDAKGNLPLLAPDEINWSWHLSHVAEWQRRIDGGISKTVGVPEQTTLADAFDLLARAWRLDLKSVSLYRSGSRRPAIEAIQ